MHVNSPPIGIKWRISFSFRAARFSRHSSGHGFAAVACVTEQRWVCCAVRDEIEFGLVSGGELELEATVCHEIRQSHQAVVIDNAAEDAAFCGHRTPAKSGFQSYISCSGRHFSETAGWPWFARENEFLPAARA
jgi:hypothetical protein